MQNLYQLLKNGKIVFTGKNFECCKFAGIKPPNNLKNRADRGIKWYGYDVRVVIEKKEISQNTESFYYEEKYTSNGVDMILTKNKKTGVLIKTTFLPLNQKS